MPNDSDSLNLINSKFQELQLTLKAFKGNPLPSSTNNLIKNNDMSLQNELSHIDSVHEEIKESIFTSI